MPGWYVATAYGAVGNGVTDDGPALQAWLTAAGNSGVGGVAYLPPSATNYRCLQTLNVPSGIFIIGAGQKSIIDFHRVLTTDAHYLNLNGVSAVTIDNIALTASGNSNRDDNHICGGIVIVSSTDIQINRLYSLLASIGVLGNLVTRVSITNSIFEKTLGNCVFFNDEAVEIQVIGNAFTNNIWNGQGDGAVEFISSAGYSHDLVVANNVIDSCAAGVNIAAYNFVIANNTMRNLSLWGVWVDSYETGYLISYNFAIVGNTITDCAQDNGVAFVGVRGDGMRLSGCRDFLIADNTIRNVVNTFVSGGIQQGGCGINFYNFARNYKIIDNDIGICASVGIGVQQHGTNDATILTDFLTNFVETGSYVGIDHGQIIGNKLATCGASINSTVYGYGSLTIIGESARHAQVVTVRDNLHYNDNQVGQPSVSDITLAYVDGYDTGGATNWIQSAGTTGWVPFNTISCNTGITGWTLT